MWGHSIAFSKYGLQADRSIGQIALGATQLQSDLGKLYLGTRQLDWRNLASLDPPLRSGNTALGQGQRLLSQIHTHAGLEIGVERLNDISTQFVTRTLQLDRGNALALLCQINPSTSLTAELYRLSDLDGGRARVATGVLHFPGELRVGDQPCLLPITFGYPNRPSSRCEARVIFLGLAQGLAQ